MTNPLSPPWIPPISVIHGLFAKSKFLAVSRIITFCQLTPADRRAMRQAARATAEKYPTDLNAQTFVEKLTQ